MPVTGIRPFIDIAPGPGGDPDAPMTDVQAVEMRDLCERLGEPFDGGLTETQARVRIDHLKARLED